MSGASEMGASSSTTEYAEAVRRVAASEGRDRDAIEEMGRLLWVEREDEARVAAMREHGERLVSALVDVAGNATADAVEKAAALSALANLAFADSNKEPMFRAPGLLDAVVKAADRGETSEIKERAMGTLQSLAFAPANKEAMFNAPGVLDVVVKAAAVADTHLTLPTKRRV